MRLSLFCGWLPVFFLILSLSVIQTIHLFAYAQWKCETLRERRKSINIMQKAQQRVALRTHRITFPLRGCVMGAFYFFLFREREARMRAQCRTRGPASTSSWGWRVDYCASCEFPFLLMRGVDAVLQLASGRGSVRRFERVPICTGTLRSRHRVRWLWMWRCAAWVRECRSQVCM